MTLDDQEWEEHIAMLKASKKSLKGFISAPSPEQLKLTPQEQAHINNLLAWEAMSAKSQYVFGPSITCAKCHAQNNPNNISCHQCGAAIV